MIIKMTEIKQTDDPISEYYVGMWCKDIYLKKDGEIIGLHAIGEKDAEWTQVGIDGTRTQIKGFMQHEQWGNNYDENHKMLGRGSFRIFEDIEKFAEELEKDGWVSYEGPTKKEKT
jgi:hypothetical protein